MYYTQETFLTMPVGNNAINFQDRKNLGSDGILRIASLKIGNLGEVVLCGNDVCYEYVDDRGFLTSASGLQSLIQIPSEHKDIFIIDNHNHAFSCRWRSFFSGTLRRSSHLIHIDQHSDFAEPSLYLSEFCTDNNLDIDISTIDRYTNELLTIASFIKPALASGFCSDHDMILSEYALLNYDFSIMTTNQSLILDIDLDFRAPEMSTEYYADTINKVRNLMSLPQVHCITIATSPTYIDQKRALEILHDILS